MRSEGQYKLGSNDDDTISIPDCLLSATILSEGIPMLSLWRFILTFIILFSYLMSFSRMLCDFRSHVVHSFVGPSVGPFRWGAKNKARLADARHQRRGRLVGSSWVASPDY